MSTEEKYQTKNQQHLYASTLCGKINYIFPTGDVFEKLLYSMGAWDHLLGKKSLSLLHAM